MPAGGVLADGLDPAVLLEVDAYWATAGGADTPALLGRLGERVYALHIKDGDLATDGSGQVPAGRGRVPMAEVLAAAPTALRVVEFCVLETFRPTFSVEMSPRPEIGDEIGTQFSPSVEPSALSTSMKPPNVRNRRNASMPALLGISIAFSPVR